MLHGTGDRMATGMSCETRTLVSPQLMQGQPDQVARLEDQRCSVEADRGSCSAVPAVPGRRCPSQRGRDDGYGPSHERRPRSTFFSVAELRLSTEMFA